MLTVEGLLSKIEPLSAVDRASHLVALGRRLRAHDPSLLDGLLASLLDAAAASQHYRTLCALRLAKAGAQRAVLLSLLGSPYPDVAAGAAKALAVSPSPSETEAIVAMIPDLPLSTVEGLLAGAGQAGSSAFADALLPVVRTTRGDALAGSFLCLCSSAVVDEHVVDLWPRLSKRRRFAQRHPDAALRTLRAYLDGSSQPSLDWIDLGAPQTITGLLTADADRFATPVLDLIEAASPVRCRAAFESAFVVAALSTRSPVRVCTLLVVLLTDPGEAASARRLLGRHLVRRLLAVTSLDGAPVTDGADGAPLVRIGRAVRGSDAFARILAVVPPSRRVVFWDLVHADVPADRLLISDDLLDLLPRRRRHGEAVRLAQLADEAGQPARRLDALAFLPLPEVEDELRAATTSADPGLRAAGYATLVGCAARTQDQAELTRVLTWLSRLRNEQEPVRSAVLTALAAVPAGLFTDESAPVLDTIFRDAAEARDHSATSARAIRRTCVRILVDGRAGPVALTSPLGQVAAAVLGYVGGPLRLPHLSEKTPSEREAVVRSLLPLIHEEAAKGQHVVLLALLRALGRRGCGNVELVALVEDLLLAGAFFGRPPTWTDMAISLLLVEPTTRDAVVRRIVARLPSAVLHRYVWPIVSRRLTDLLTTEVLTGQLRDYPSRVHGTWVPSGLSGASGWTPGQVAETAAYLDAVTSARPLRSREAARGVAALALFGDRERGAVGPPGIG